MPPRLRPDKRAAITAASRTVFGRDGYTRASIDAIAQASGVSTRTIYKHFDNKAELFSAVIVESATEVADRLVDVIDEHLRPLTDPEAPAAPHDGTQLELDERLVALAHAWSTTKARFPDHFAMVAHITTEAAHFPPAALAAWRRAGPERAESALAHHVERLHERGILDLDLRRVDPRLAASHFLVLTAGVLDSRGRLDGATLPRHEIDRVVRAGVAAFLDGHRGAGAARPQS